MLEVKNISKKFVSFGVFLTVLSDISFNLRKGEIISILGKTGIGKSTLLNIISGIYKQDEGKVAIKGLMGYVPQKDLLLPWRNILENILLPAEISGKIDNSVLDNVMKLIREYGFEDCYELYPNEISGGMKQKVSLMRMLVQNPDVVLFDEPFSAIDTNSRIEVIEKIRKLIVSTDKSAILVTHSIEEAISFSDKVIVLGGKPAKIIAQEEISISEDKRTSLIMRNSEEFEKLFVKIWQIIKKDL